MVPASSALVWFRRDLRAYDHAALHAALRRYTQQLQVLCHQLQCFIWQAGFGIAGIAVLWPEQA